MFKEFLKGVTGFFGESVVDGLKEQVDDAVDHAKERAEALLERVIKRLISFFLVLTGLVFGLVGLGMFLSRRVPALGDGIGYILVGLVLVLLAWFAWYMRAEQKA